MCFEKGKDTLKYVREEGWLLACCATKHKIQKLLLQHHCNLLDKTRQETWTSERTIQKGPFFLKQMQDTSLMFPGCLPAEVYSQHCCLFPPPLQKTPLQSQGCFTKLTQDFRVQIPVKAGGAHCFPRHAVLPTCFSAYLLLLYPVRNLLRGQQAREIYCQLPFRHCKHSEKQGDALGHKQQCSTRGGRK